MVGHTSLENVKTKQTKSLGLSYCIIPSALFPKLGELPCKDTVNSCKKCHNFIQNTQIRTPQLPR